MTAIAFLIGLACGGLVAWCVVRVRLARRDRADNDQLLADVADANERLTELATLTGGLAHEIRNPLSTLKVNLQLLAEDWRNVGEATESDLCRRSLGKIETLRNEADRLQEILDDFLHYIGRQELHPTRVDLNQLVDDVLVFFRPQAQAQRVQVLATLCAEPLVCDVDVAKFKQALLNLFVNAQQAMPDGGELMVRTGAVAETAECESSTRVGGVSCPVGDAPSYGCVEVIDTGSGIAPEELGKIFHPYYSTKREGTGLGLPTTRRIVQAHGGTIKVHSEPNQGTRFALRLPLATDEKKVSG